MTSKNKIQSPKFNLLVKLQNIEFRSKQPARNDQFVYFSLSIGDRMYFSSCISHRQTVLSDDIIIPIMDSQLPQILILNRWQNHMIMLTHQIDISQLKTRTTTKKKHESKAGEILSFMILVLNEQELRYGQKLIQSISQHYLIIQQMNIKQNKTKKRADIGPSFYLIKTSGNDYVMPILDGQLCIKLPETLVFEHFRNGKLQGKSRQYNSDEIRQRNTQIQLKMQNGENYSICLKVKWGINFFETKTENSLLLEAHELIIYDIEVKFDSYIQYANARVKFVYGNKGFQVGNQFNSSKPFKIKKIIYFIIKSQDEQINIVVQRNLKIVAQSKFFTDQINSYMVHNPKRKFIDDNGKAVGTIKFKCQKAKNLSTPNNNKFWKESNKKKLVNMVLLSIEQLSVTYQKNQPVCITVKSEAQQRVVNNIPNFVFFDKQLQISYAPVVITAKPDQNVYMMIKSQQVKQEGQNKLQNDFIGIAILNFSDLKLGVNSTQISFYKNQGKTASANCLINKVTPYPFVKSIFQPQILNTTAHKTMSLTIFMKKVNFTPYFYTYRYDNKNEVYCIVQINRLKKVLIMESIIHDELSFIPSSSSDSLNFYIEQTQYLKIKITFIVSDVGQQQQIYGFAITKLKNGELQAAPDALKYNKMELRNQFGNQVGWINFQIHGSSNNSKPIYAADSVSGPFKNQIKRVQNDINKVNFNMEIMEQSIKKSRKKITPPLQLRRSQDIGGSIYLKKSQARYDNSINYAEKRRQRNHSVAGTNNESIRLPFIHEDKYNKNKNKNNVNLKDLVNMMKIRKRDTRGYYEQNSNIRQNQPKKPISERSAQIQKGKLKQQYQAPFYTQKDSRQNQNVDKSMQMIFGKKISNPRHDQIRNQINQYEQKVRRLKMDLNNIEQSNSQQNDVENIVVSGNKKKKQNNSIVINNLNNMQFDDNQFVRPAS